MVVATKIDTVTARQKLTARHAPYWHRIMQGQYIGYRKISDQAPGTWIARYRDVGTGKVSLNSLGALDTVTPSDQYDAAVKAADAWFSHRERGGSAEVLTVAHACARYVDNLHSHGREKTAVDAVPHSRPSSISPSKSSSAESGRSTRPTWAGAISRTLCPVTAG